MTSSVLGPARDEVQVQCHRYRFMQLLLQISDSAWLQVLVWWLVYGLLKLICSWHSLASEHQEDGDEKTDDNRASVCIKQYCPLEFVFVNDRKESN